MSKEKSKRMMIMPGDVFTRLTFIEETRSEQGNRMGLFNCSCGITKELRIKLVIAGEQKSCGCLRRERLQGKGKAVAQEMQGMPVFTSDYLTDEMIGWVVSPVNFSLSNY